MDLGGRILNLLSSHLKLIVKRISPIDKSLSLLIEYIDS